MINECFKYQFLSDEGATYQQTTILIGYDWFITETITLHCYFQDPDKKLRMKMTKNSRISNENFDFDSNRPDLMN